MTVTVEEVGWCYRYLLGREPESDLAARSHAGSKDFRALVESFIRSAEFQDRLRDPAKTAAGAGRLQALDLPPNEVDVLATDAEMAAAVAIIKETWSHLGRVKPHFSVLTDAQFLPEHLAGSIDHFWATGDHEAEIVRRLLAQRGVSPVADKICVEYGCGVGRVTMGLAKYFQVVHGYDISPGHLECARDRADELGLGNVNLHLCSEILEADLEKCDFFYSRIVFQHNPPPIIALLIRKAVKALNPEGLAVFQVPTYGLDYRFKLGEWLTSEHSLDMQMHCLSQQDVFEIVASEGGSVIEVREDNCTGAPDKYLSNTFIVKKNHSGLTTISC